MQKPSDPKPQRPAQEQDRQPGIESEMRPRPRFDAPKYKGSEKLKGKAALITGGDSGIGRSVAVLFAREGANVAICYLDEEDDAAKTKELVEAEGQKAILLSGDIGSEKFCHHCVSETVKTFGSLDVLVNNAAEQHPQEEMADITEAQLERTFRTNIFSMFFFCKAAVEYLKEGSAIINTSSVTAYRGSEKLLDYSATKGAIVSFTRALSAKLADKQIRVNAVAPGPIWTPLIPATFPADKVAEFGSDTPLGRAGEPEEVAPCYVFLASSDSSYMTGQVLHPNGGEIVNG